MKAITPVISLIMLMLITVGIVGIAYVWFSGILAGSSEKAIAIPSGGVYCNLGSMSVTILNLGSISSITNADIKILRIDGVDLTPVAFTFLPGVAGAINTPYRCGGTCAGASHDVVVGTSANIIQTRAICK
ncbi:MAG: hypothetical protein V1836_04480 [Candidatus Aenigmatarchaeota archaeon]